MLGNGFEIIEDFKPDITLEALAEEISGLDFEARKGGIRNIDKKSDLVFSFCKSKPLLDLAAKYLPSQPKLVRAIYFNKTPSNNWLVSWHQDKTVAVSKKFNSEGWGPWSIKDGTHHVQPPLNVLEQMVALRIHFDSSTPENGCLKVIPNSHEFGVLNQEQIVNIVSKNQYIECNLKPGTILAMRPHLLHSSSKASKPSSRRVLHLEYSSFDLPSGICWA